MKLAVPGGDSGLGDPHDVLLVLAAPRDEVGDRDQREFVLVREHAQFVGAGHFALVLLRDDLADDAGGTEVGHAGEIDGGFGMPGAAQDTALLGTQRHDVAGPGEVVGAGVGIGEQAHGRRTVGRGDAGADAFLAHRR